MPLQAPNLDDRSYADLFAEARTLIPRYAPEWTDFNDTDPGITLLQLFAWMTDLLLYRVNQVPDLNYIKFLQLLGIEQQPAQPALVELTFTPARKDIQTFSVPQGTQVGVANSGGGPPLIFETREGLIGIGATLAAIQTYDGFSYITNTTKDKSAGQWYYPFGPNAAEGSALLLGFDSTLDFPQDQINLAVFVYTDDTQPQPTGRQCSLDLAQSPAPATLAWEFWNGGQWEALNLNKDETRAFSRNGHIYFTGPGIRAQKAQVGNIPDMLYWLRSRLVRNNYDRSPRLASILTNTTLATQALTVRAEVVGGSNGRPDQTFTLANAPVVTLDKPFTVAGADGFTVTVISLQLTVDEGAGPLAWQEVEDFYGSGPNDPHYVLNRTTGGITFGNGQRGRIPLALLGSPNSNIVAQQYLYGGGLSGNVGANTVTAIQTYVEGVDTVTNPMSAYGGADEETLDDAKLRAPQELKSKGRAVTAEDYELLAMQTPGASIRRANALPLTHPKYPGTPIPGVVTVVVVPDSDSPTPTPGAATLSLVCAYLNARRLLTSEVYVVPPEYHKVEIRASLIAQGNADLGEVQQTVIDALTAYFSALTGGDSGLGWDFGGTIFYSKVYRVILQTPGLDRIQDNQLEIWLDDEMQPFCRDVPIPNGALLYSVSHQIDVTYDLQG